LKPFKTSKTAAVVSLETAVSYETVPGEQPSQQLAANYDVVAADNYHLLGEERNFKTSSAVQLPADNYDDVILPNKNFAKDPGKGFVKPPAPPPPAEIEEYCTVTKGAKVVVQGDNLASYDHLIHQHQKSRSASDANQQLDCYSKLTEARYGLGD
jgi:hypothetical protein